MLCLCLQESKSWVLDKVMKGAPLPPASLPGHNTTTGVVQYSGVEKWNEKFRAKIQRKALTRHLGTFDTVEDAAKAWDKVVWVLGGRRSELNFPELMNEYDSEVGVCRIASALCAL